MKRPDINFRLRKLQGALDAVGAELDELLRELVKEPEHIQPLQDAYEALWRHAHYILEILP